MKYDDLYEFLTARKCSGLYYVCHLKNLRSIIEKGILCKDHVTALKLPHVDISNRSVQRRRDEPRSVYRRAAEYVVSPHKYVPLFFAHNTPMLYVAVQAHGEYIILLQIRPEICKKGMTLFSDGNIANGYSKLYDSVEYIGEIEWDTVDGAWGAWSSENKRARSAEVLIHQKIAPEYISAIHVNRNLPTKFCMEAKERIGSRGRDDILVTNDLTAEGLVG